MVSKIGDLVFGPLPKNSEGVNRMPTLIGRFEDHAFHIFMDDHSAAARNSKTMFTFLHRKYFPRVAFGPIYLSGPNIHVFAVGPSLSRPKLRQPLGSG